MVHRYSRILQLVPPAVKMWAAYAMAEDATDPLGYVLEPVISLALVEQWTEIFDGDSDVPSEDARSITRCVKAVTVESGTYMDVEENDSCFELLTDFPGTSQKRDALRLRAREHLAVLARRAQRQAKQAQ